MIKPFQIASSAEERIVAAATKIFVTKGLAGARVRDIASEAKVNPAMIYYYYRSKQTLFSLVFENAISKFLPPIDYFNQADLDIFKKIELFCDELIALQIANPYVSVFILNEIEKNPQRIKNEMWLQQKERIQLFTREVQKCSKNKIIKKVAPMQLLMNILSLCIFPSIAKSLFIQLSDLSESEITTFMQHRRTEVKKNIIHSIEIKPGLLC